MFHFKYHPGKKNCVTDTLLWCLELQMFLEQDDVVFSDDITIAIVTTTAAALWVET